MTAERDVCPLLCACPASAQPFLREARLFPGSRLKCLGATEWGGLEPRARKVKGGWDPAYRASGTHRPPSECQQDLRKGLLVALRSLSSRFRKAKRRLPWVVLTWL